MLIALSPLCIRALIALAALTAQRAVNAAVIFERTTCVMSRWFCHHAAKKTLDEFRRISRIRPLAAAHRFFGNGTRTATPPPPNEMIERRC